ncbi:MAG: hypothetical protein J2P16_00225 [Mycobacterium sp.]|nr:hypothetical protein [Mycobacterium sp.]
MSLRLHTDGEFDHGVRLCDWCDRWTLIGFGFADPPIDVATVDTADIVGDHWQTLRGVDLDCCEECAERLVKWAGLVADADRRWDES